MTNGPSAALGLEIHSGPEGARLTVRGDLDLATAQSLVDAAETVFRGPTGALTIDLSGVAFCDSAGINALVGLRNRCERSAWSFRVVNLQPQVHRVVVDLTGLGAFLNVGADPR